MLHMPPRSRTKINGAMNESVALDFTGMFRSKPKGPPPKRKAKPAAEVHTHALAAHYRVGHLYSLEQCTTQTPMAYVEDFGEPELYYIRVPEGSYTPLPREQSKLRGEYRPRDSVWLYDYCLHRHNAFEKVRAEPSWPQPPPHRSCPQLLKRLSSSPPMPSERGDWAVAGCWSARASSMMERCS